MPTPSRSRPRAIVSLLLLLIRTKIEGSCAVPVRSHPRLRIAAGLAGALALVLGGSWVALNLASHEPPTLLWSQLEIPDPEDNGWSQETLQSLEVEVPNELRSLLDGEGLDWARVDRHAEPLREFLASEDARAATAWIEVARRRPELAPTCDIHGPCAMFEWQAAHRVASLHALEHGHHGDPAPAYELLADLVRMDRAALDGTHTLVGVWIAMANLRSDFQLSAMIVERHGAGAPGARTRAASDELAGAVEAATIADFDLRRVVIGEYLFIAHALEAFEDGDDDARELDVPAWPRWMYSRALTLRELNERFEARHAAAIAGDSFGAFGGGERPASEEFGWWLQNPVGDLLIDAMRYDAAELAESHDDKLAELQRGRVRLIESLAAATRRALATPPPPPARAPE